MYADGAIPVWLIPIMFPNQIVEYNLQPKQSEANVLAQGPEEILPRSIFQAGVTPISKVDGKEECAIKEEGRRQEQ